MARMRYVVVLYIALFACQAEQRGAPDALGGLSAPGVATAGTLSAPAFVPEPAATAIPVATPPAAWASAAAPVAVAAAPATAGAVEVPAEEDTVNPLDSVEVDGDELGEEQAAAEPLTFDAGSGELQPDGKTVIFRIADGTGGNDWNSMDDPIRVRRGMVLRLVDEDKSTRNGWHYLHTYGQPCGHGTRKIGDGYDCVISERAPLGIVDGVAEHNIRNGIGHLHIEVVEGE